MRRLSQRRQIWLNFHSANGPLRNRLKKQRRAEHLSKKARNITVEVAAEKRITLYSGGATQEAILDGEKRPVPNVLRLRSETWDQTVGFINNVRRGLNLGLARTARRLRRRAVPNLLRLRSYWDFSTLQDVSVPVALMLASEYDRARELNGWVPRAVNLESWHPSVRAMLNAIGFLDLAGVEPTQAATIEPPQGRFLRLQRGRSADGEAIGHYLSELGIDLTNEDPRLNDAIMEAVTNTVHHAYRDKTLCEPYRLKAWWIAGSVSASGDHRVLSLVVYDQGASIPRTLSTWDKYPLVRRALASILPWGDREPDPLDTRYDGDAIKVAIQVGQTSTKESNRGKGLSQIVQALELSKGGSVHIFSRCGVWQQRAGEEAQAINHASPMIGTLIIWRLVI